MKNNIDRELHLQNQLSVKKLVVYCDVALRHRISVISGISRHTLIDIVTHTQYRGQPMSSPTFIYLFILITELRKYWLFVLSLYKTTIRHIVYTDNIKML